MQFEMGSFWRGVILLCTLYVITVQHSTAEKTPESSAVKKPSSVYGCYSGEEGTFFWKTSGDILYLNISAKVTEDDWVALAISDDERMGNDDVVAVYKLPDESSFNAASLIDPHSYASTRVQEIDSILSSSASYVGGELKANITKSIAKSYPFKTLKDTAFYLFFGRGKVRNPTNPDKPIHMHRKIPTISREPVSLFKNVKYCISEDQHDTDTDDHHDTDTDRGKTTLLLKLHGILMILVWMNLIPITMYIARYGKEFFEKPSTWFIIHKWGSLFSVVIAVVSVVIAYVALGGLRFELHQTIGVVVMILLVLHVLLALFRPAPETRFRKLWEVVHRIISFVLFIGNLTNIVDGLYLYKANVVSYVMISVQLFIFGLIVITLDNSTQVGSCLQRFCFKPCPTIFYFMNLGGTTPKSALVKLGLWTMVIVNTVVSLVVVVALIEAKH